MRAITLLIAAGLRMDHDRNDTVVARTVDLMLKKMGIPLYRAFTSDW